MAIALGILVSGCTSTSSGLSANPAAVHVASSLPAPDPVVLSPAATYHVGPRDEVRIDVYGAPELSRTMTVDDAGNIAVPWIGELKIAGFTTAEVSTVIADHLRGRFLKDPRVVVDVTQMKSQQFTVDGAVTQPGVYPIEGRMSLLRAVATAHGATEYGRLDQVVIFRRAGGQNMAALFDLKGIREGKYADPEVKAGDTIIVGESRGRRTLKDIVTALPGIGIFAAIF
jgi:polysaccharide biosynthesis/export protein